MGQPDRRLPSERGGIGYSVRKLAKFIFEAEAPEHVVRELPAQALHIVVRHLGIESSSELVELASPEQRQLMLDFDLWRGDSFDEDRFFEWLGLTDATDSLELLQKLLKVFDLKLVAILIARYCDARILDEPSETPPEEGFHTPDKGNSWLKVNHPDARKGFLLARLLAMIFESNAGVYYNLLAVPSLSTPSVLEEESFAERNKRLWSEGIPDPDFAHQLHAPFTSDELTKILGASQPANAPITVRPVAPLIYDSTSLEPLDSLARDQTLRDTLEAELSLIMNAALVRWTIDFADREQLSALTQRVRGALNLGLELAIERTAQEPVALYQATNLQTLYRLGMGQLREISRAASNVARRHGAELHEDAALSFAVDTFRLPFPMMPSAFQLDGSIEPQPDGTILQDRRAVSHRREIIAIQTFLERIQDRLARPR